MKEFTQTVTMSTVPPGSSGNEWTYGGGSSLSSQSYWAPVWSILSSHSIWWPQPVSQSAICKPLQEVNTTNTQPVRIIAAQIPDSSLLTLSFLLYSQFLGEDVWQGSYSYIGCKTFQAIKWLPKFMLSLLNVSFYFKHILDHFLESITSLYYVFLSAR